MSKIEKQHPLILVFYIDKELMSNPDIMQPFVDHVNNMIIQKEANMMTFFLPTDGEERIECINPIQIEPAKMDEIMGTINDIAKNFLDIGQGADDGKNNPENEIEANAED